MRHASSAALLLLLLASPLAAQDKLVETLEVRVVNIDVVVRDQAGKPVTGLTPADFELFENGKPQTITNLYEVRPSAPAAANAAVTPAPQAATQAPVDPRPRRFVLLVDDYSIDPARRSRVLDSLERFVDQHMRPTDQAMLVRWNQHLDMVTEATSDRQKIHAGIATLRLQSRGPGTSYRQAIDALKQKTSNMIEELKAQAQDHKVAAKYTWGEAYEISLADINANIEESIMSSRQLLADLGRLTGGMAGMDGRKVIVFAGAHLPERPGAELYGWLYSTYSSYYNVPLDMQAVSGRMGASQRYSIAEAAKQASKVGVALYMIDAADSRDSGSAENAIAVSGTESFENFVNTAVAYQTLARISGGIAVTGSNNFDLAFDTVARDLESYYSLGYRPATDAPADRKIEVKLKNRAYSARYRESYTVASPEGEMESRVRANVYEPAASEWQISITAGEPKPENGKFRVPVEVEIPSTFTLIPKEGSLQGGFTVFFAVGNRSGETTPVTKSPHPLKIAQDAEEELRGGPMTYKTSLLVNPGENFVSVAVLDQVSNNVGFARATITGR